MVKYVENGLIDNETSKENNRTPTRVDAYSSMTPDPTFTFISGPSCPALQIVLNIIHNKTHLSQKC
jgi:hypothetical protein